MAKLNLRAAAVLGSLMVASVATSAQATVLFNSNGFEAPAYVAGATLSGQPAGAASNASKWGESVSNTTAAGQVTTSIRTASSAAPFTGQRATIVLSNLPNNATAFYVPLANTAQYGTPYTPAANEGISIRWSMSTGVTSDPTLRASGNPFFGIQAFGVNAAGQTVPIAQAGIDATTGGIRGITAAAYAPFVSAPSTYYTYQLFLNFTKQEYYIYSAPYAAATATPDYTLLGAGNFVNPAVSFSDGDLAAFAATGSSAMTGFGSYDDYVVQTAAIPVVPEPAGLAVAGLASALLAGRRRRAAV